MSDTFKPYFGYVENLGGDGWIKVKFNDGLIWPLPEYLRVYVTKTSEREEFKVIEGRFKGKKASVKKKGWSWTQWDWDRSFFEDEMHTKEGCPHKGASDLIFYRRSKKLKVAGLGEFNAKTEDTNPTPLGRHEIEIPYEPHGLGSGYTGQAQYAKTWFRVGHSGDRFLHCGSVSAGCITVTDINKWDEIYQHLIISRKGSDSVGIVNVIDS